MSVIRLLHDCYMGAPRDGLGVTGCPARSGVTQRSRCPAARRMRSYKAVTYTPVDDKQARSAFLEKYYEKGARKREDAKGAAHARHPAVLVAGRRHAWDASGEDGCGGLSHSDTGGALQMALQEADDGLMPRGAANRFLQRMPYAYGRQPPVLPRPTEHRTAPVRPASAPATPRSAPDLTRRWNAIFEGCAHGAKVPPRDALQRAQKVLKADMPLSPRHRAAPELPPRRRVALIWTPAGAF